MSRAIASVGFILAVGCGGDPRVEGPQPSEGTLFLWIGADQDTYTKCSVAAYCANGDQNHPLQGELHVSNETAVELKRAYMHFSLPTLPDGAEIVRAHLEVYNGAKQGDGKSDDVCLGVTKLGEAWDPFALTWDDQPVDQALTGQFGLSFRSQAWTTANVTAAVREHFVYPNKNFGFAITANSEIDKAFYSLNAPSRTAKDLGLAPRLLIEIELPAGSDPIEWPENVASPSDLPFPGKDVIIARTATGEDFPADWNAAVYQDRCPG